MTDADTQTATVGGASPIAALVAGSGLMSEPNVVDSAGLATVAGPLLTANLVDTGGSIVGAVAVLDDPASEPDAMVGALAQAAATEGGPGTEIQPADPVGDGSELGSRFTTPVAVAAFGDGSQIRALVVTSADRRGQEAGAAAAQPVIPGAPLGGSGPLDKLINVSLDVSVELGRTRVTLADVLDYDVGSVVELDRAAGAPVDIRVNGTLLAQGEVVLIDDEYAVRVTAILDPNASS